MEKKELKEFIYFFTHNKTLTRNQQLKRDALLARDYHKLYNKRTISDIEENKTNTTNNKKTTYRRHRPGVNEKTKYTSPKNIQSFLKEFNQDDILKYTCHLIDADEVIYNICNECFTKQYDFTKHIELIIKRFENLKEKFKRNKIFLDNKMIALINTYLAGTTGKNDNRENKFWSSNNIDINWNCQQIHKWATEHPHLIPTPGKNIAKKQKNVGYVLPTAFISDVTGIRIKSFSDLVIFFKSQFHIRQDNSMFAILSKINDKWNPEDVIIKFSKNSFNNNIELFTDVDKFIQTYKKIIELCIEHRREKNEPVQIELSFYDDVSSNETYFFIHHLNTQYKKSSKNAIERIGTSHSELISHQINGLCDLYIEAKFSDKNCGIINLWNDDREFKFSQSKEDIEGVKYIMVF